MITITPITPHNVWVFKAVRLRALQDTPHAFGATYAKESQLPDSDWIKRVERMNGEIGVGFLAIDKDEDKDEYKDEDQDKDDGIACGIAGSFLDQNDPTRAELISMWTAPTHRQRGVGRLLVNEVLNWARGRNARVLRLMVVGNNDAA